MEIGLRVSTVSFRYYLQGGDTAGPNGLFDRLCHAFLVSLYFLMWAKVSRMYWTDFHIFSPSCSYLCECCWSGPFFRFLSFQPIFTARRYAKRGICRRRVSVCRSVSLSHSGIASKQL